MRRKPTQLSYISSDGVTNFNLVDESFFFCSKYMWCKTYRTMCTRQLPSQDGKECQRKNSSANLFTRQIHILISSLSRTTNHNAQWYLWQHEFQIANRHRMTFSWQITHTQDTTRNKWICRKYRRVLAIYSAFFSVNPFIFDG